MVDNFDARNRMVRRVYAEQRRRKKNLWWCSFANDDGFLGAAIVEAIGDTGARQRCRELGIDPGGEMLASPAHEDVPRPPDKYMNRLLSNADLSTPEAIALFDPVNPPNLDSDLVEISEDITTYVQDDTKNAS